MDRAARVEAANRNVVESFDRLRIHFRDPRGARRRFGAVEAVAVGHDTAFFNPVLAFDEGSSVPDVVGALEWVESLGLPASVVIDDAARATIGRALEDLGLQAGDELTAVMTLDLEPPPFQAAQPAPIARPEPVVRTGGFELADEWWAALEASERMRALFGAGLIASPDVRIAVADLAGKPAAGAMAIRSDEVVGVYAVWTAEWARRRGLGRAVTRGVIQAGIDLWGSRIAILHSTDMGFPVYRALGFEQVGSVVLYRRPDTAGS